MQLGEAFEDREPDAQIAMKLMAWRFIHVGYNVGVLVRRAKSPKKKPANM